jgi:hypothetical protein
MMILLGLTPAKFVVHASSPTQVSLFILDLFYEALMSRKEKSALF